MPISLQPQSHPQSDSEGAPDPSDPLLRVLAALLLAGTEGTRPEVLGYGPNEVRLRTPQDRFLVLLRQTGADFVPAHLALALLSGSGGDLILVGGPSTLLNEWKQAYPELSRTLVGVHQVAEGGEVNTLREGPSVRTLDARLKAQAPLSEADIFRLRGMADDDVARAMRRLRGMAAFQAVLYRRPLRVVWALLGVLALMFLIQQFLGDSPVVAYRLGALDRQRLWMGEWWRLISCTFLHAGFTHFAFNAYVLFALGNGLERLLGWSRFLLLYVTSALVAGLVSAWAFKTGTSVGASGAVWGLLVCEAGLAWSRQKILPEALVAQMRRAAGFNLILNLVNSFTPHVDWAAHLGGGLAGGALFLSGILTRNLTAFGDGAAIGDPTEVLQNSAPTEPRWRRLAGAATGLLLVIGLGTALIQGRAWELTEPPRLEDTELPEQRVTLQLPGYSHLSSIELQGEASWEATFGKIGKDPAVVILSAFPPGTYGSGKPGDELAEANALGVGPSAEAIPDSWAEEAPHATTVAGHPVLRGRFRLTHRPEQRWDALLWKAKPGWLRLDVLCDEKVGRACPSPDDILRSVESY